MTRKSIFVGAILALIFLTLPGEAQYTRRARRVVSITTADQGYFLFPQGHFPEYGTTTVLIHVVNAVRGVQVVLPYRLKVSVIQVYVATARGSSFFGCGIYSADKSTLLLETGAISTATTGLKKVTLSTPVTLNPGVYWYAWTSNNTSARLQGSNGTANMDVLFSDTNPQMGNIGSLGVSGVMPASLGTVGYASFDIPCALMKS